MMLLAAAADKLTVGESLTIALLGIAIGFIVLALLMVLVYIMRFVIGKLGSSKSVSPGYEAMQITNMTAKSSDIPASANKIPAKGSAGEVFLNSVDDKTAALLMAIVANEMGVPLNELRFISIREI